MNKINSKTNYRRRYWHVNRDSKWKKSIVARGNYRPAGAKRHSG